jgi:hypothetical protein
MVLAEAAGIALAVWEQEVEQEAEQEAEQEPRLWCYC